MKGIVFTEFLELVENRFGEIIAEEIIEESSLASSGAYTSVGTYDHGEILAMITKLSEKTQVAVPDLVKAFGSHLAGVFSKKFPIFFEQSSSLFEFLGSIEDVIHVEVRKLYPDAELPKFEYEHLSGKEMIIKYTSSRPFADLAEGLIDGAISYYNEDVEVNSEDISNGEGTGRKFYLKHK